MAIKYSVAVRDARLNAIEVTIGVSAILEIRTGAAPANCAAADSGTLLASLALPADWMGASAAGVKALAGTWEDASANASGTAAHFRLKETTGVTCHMQGTISGIGGGGDMIIDNPVFVATQSFSITSFSITEGNA